jgi:hypothetical protein
VSKSKKLLLVVSLLSFMTAAGVYGLYLFGLSRLYTYNGILEFNPGHIHSGTSRSSTSGEDVFFIKPLTHPVHFFHGKVALSEKVTDEVLKRHADSARIIPPGVTTEIRLPYDKNSLFFWALWNDGRDVIRVEFKWRSNFGGGGS